MICTSCGAAQLAAARRCPKCFSWGSLSATWAPSATTSGATSTDQDPPPAPARMATGIEWLDDLLDGGSAVGCSYLLAGPPGAGKSTLLTAIGAGMAARSSVLLATAEEAKGPVMRRAHRIGATSPSLYVDAYDGGSLGALLEDADPHGALLVDSIQGFAGDRLGLIRAACKELQQWARPDRVVWILGHVTSDGSIAGPRTLEHDVDGVLYLGADRVLTIHKHREGRAPASALLRMTATGLTYAGSR